MDKSISNDVLKAELIELVEMFDDNTFEFEIAVSTTANDENENVIGAFEDKSHPAHFAPIFRDLFSDYLQLIILQGLALVDFDLNFSDGSFMIATAKLKLTKKATINQINSTF